jgi:hypothetical protein
MKIKNIVLVLCMVFLIGLASASLGTYKIGECVNIKTILPNATTATISTISYPNSSIATSNQNMTKTAQTFNYSFCNTSTSGVYVYDYYDDGGNTYVNDFTINANGKADPAGGIVTLFVILFILLAGVTCYLAIYTIGHLMSLDFDLIDLAFDWGLFFAIGAFYFLEMNYLGNIGMELYLNWFLSVGGILLVLLPLIAFILSITIGSLQRKKVTQTVPQKFRFGGRHG